MRPYTNASPLKISVSGQLGGAREQIGALPPPYRHLLGSIVREIPPSLLQHAFLLSPPKHTSLLQIFQAPLPTRCLAGKRPLHAEIWKPIATTSSQGVPGVERWLSEIDCR